MYNERRTWISIAEEVVDCFFDFVSLFVSLFLRLWFLELSKKLFVFRISDMRVIQLSIVSKKNLVLRGNDDRVLELSIGFRGGRYFVFKWKDELVVENERRNDDLVLELSIVDRRSRRRNLVFGENSDLVVVLSVVFENRNLGLNRNDVLNVDSWILVQVSVSDVFWLFQFKFCRRMKSCCIYFVQR